MRRIVLGFALLLACGSPPAPNSADDAEAEAGGESEAAGEPDMGGGEESAETSPDDQPSSGPVQASEADLAKILQLVLDDEALQPYLHLEEPERMPLKVHGEMLPTGLELTMARKPVQYVDASVASDPKKPVLVFTEIAVQGDRATIAYRYDVEKVRGSATVVKADGTWTLHKSRISERDYKPSEK